MTTRNDIITRVSSLYPKLTNKELHAIVRGLFNKMSNSLANGQRIEVRGFGAFTLKRRPAGKVRNPRHGVAIDSPERNVVYFRPGKELAERVNAINNKD